MKTLYNALLEDNNYNEPVNEGFLLNGVSKITLNKLSQQELLDGLLNMYDYIVDKDDIKLFLQDFPSKERLFWKNLYDLNQKKVWSIIDVDNQYDEIQSIIPEFNKFIEISVPLRRKFREIIKDSRNSELDLKPSEVKNLMAIKDNLLKSNNRKNDNKIYILTINRTTGLLKRLFRNIDAKFLEKVFEKLATGR